MRQSIEIAFTSLVCSECQAKFNVRKFDANKGVCACGREFFDVAIRVRTTSSYERDSGDVMARVAIGAMAGVVGNPLRGARILGSAGDEVSTIERTYELFGLQSATITSLMQERPEIVLDFISRVRREAAKANLQPDQGLCRECGEVFKIEAAGFTTEGFCSKLCKRRFEVKNPPEPDASAPAAPMQPSVVNCPECSKPIKLKPGKAQRCVWCGTAIPGA